MAEQEHKPTTGLQTIRHFLGAIRALNASAGEIVKACGTKASYQETEAPIRAMIAESWSDMTITEAWMLRAAIVEWMAIFQGEEDPPINRVKLGLEQFVVDASATCPRDVVARAHAYGALFGTEEVEPSPEECKGMTYHALEIAQLVYGSSRSRGDTFASWHDNVTRMSASDEAA
ncbi:hypothetical protein FNB15_18280 [Ferrovibrio terrae]|uniref:Uncharacterized protein n=1 Tax=Ferrovibrio terrae TaxID=2594003 RepID=A0A516H5R5_9PROT|nr:hypothetical protein [Ferrovibrio terrae]QDO99097.1 hypothetical protein FNB15_18280 [Ferrovibrio terrae]